MNILLHKHKFIDEQINDIFSKYGITERIYKEDILACSKTLMDSTSGEPRLSNIINDYMWPNLKEATVYHFTRRDIAKRIIKTRKFRLNDLSKRMDDNEVTNFCDKYDLHWSLNNDDKKFENSLITDIFYASFADINISKEDENSMWSKFATIDGVRFKLKIKNKKIDLRKIHYLTQNTILSDISQIAKSHGLKFVLKGISKLCAYGLPLGYSKENEYRLLLNNHPGLDIQCVNGCRFIEFDIDKEKDLFEIEIVEYSSIESVLGFEDIRYLPRN